MKNLKPQNLKKQEGITLLVSVLILSGMAVVTTAVAFFVVQEIRASRAIVLTEPAISAALSGSERGVWAIKRDITMSGCDNPSSTSIGSARVDLCKDFDGPATFEVTSTAPAELYLYNPNDLADIDLSGFQYNYIQVTNNGSVSVQVQVERIDNTPVSSQSVPPGSTATISTPPVATNSVGIMRVSLTVSSGVTSVAVNTDRGMPGYPTVDASGCATPNATTTSSCSASGEIYKRRINVTVPQ